MKTVLVRKAGALELKQALALEDKSEQSKQKGIRIACPLVDPRQNTSLQTDKIFHYDAPLAQYRGTCSSLNITL